MLLPEMQTTDRAAAFESLGFQVAATPQNANDLSALKQIGYCCYTLVGGYPQPDANQGVWARPDIPSALIRVWGMANHVLINHTDLARFGDPYASWPREWARTCVDNLRDMITQNAAKVALVIHDEDVDGFSLTALPPSPQASPNHPATYLRTALALARTALSSESLNTCDYTNTYYKKLIAISVVERITATRKIESMLEH